VGIKRSWIERLNYEKEFRVGLSSIEYKSLRYTLMMKMKTLNKIKTRHTRKKLIDSS
jgi:hypothetical protein